LHWVIGLKKQEEGRGERLKNRRVPKPLFWISLLIPVLVLLGMLVKPLDTIKNGEEITLATVPIDPTDLFYGQYVMLDLEIGRVDISHLDKKLKGKLQDGMFIEPPLVYVSLEKDQNGIYQAKRVSETIPNRIYIKGKMNPVEERDSDNETFVTIDYGIERFYVEEGTGLKLEEQSRRGKVLLKVKVKDGYPILTGIKGIES
jgi:uncharacterized membrane-anchored protein